MPKAPAPESLTYVGPGTISGVPAADLSPHILERLAWIRAGAPHPRPKADPAAVARLRAELIATGNYKSSTEAIDD